MSAKEFKGDEESTSLSNHFKNLSVEVGAKVQGRSHIRVFTDN
jgi:hypothetical protein